MTDDGMKVEIDGKEYAVDDFEGRELVEVERAFEISLFTELNRSSVTGVYALLYLVKKRENPAFTPDQALALNLGTVTKMLGGDGEKQDPPPVAPKATAKKSG